MNTEQLLTFKVCTWIFFRYNWNCDLQGGIQIQKTLLLSLGFPDTTDYPEVALQIDEKTLGEKQSQHILVNFMGLSP